MSALIKDPGVLLRFDAKLDKSTGSNACWPWQGSRYSGGYGRFFVGGKSVSAHRWALSCAIGRPLEWSIDRKEYACHTCDNPPCCNPKHLYLGTGSSNVQDAVERLRHYGASKTVCVNGHVLSDAYINPKTGSRQCRACRRDRQRLHWGYQGLGSPTHCPQGHLYDEVNTYRRRNTKECRACRRKTALDGRRLAVKP